MVFLPWCVSCLHGLLAVVWRRLPAERVYEWPPLATAAAADNSLLACATIEQAQLRSRPSWPPPAFCVRGCFSGYWRPLPRHGRWQRGRWSSYTVMAAAKAFSSSLGRAAPSSTRGTQSCSPLAPSPTTARLATCANPSALSTLDAASLPLPALQRCPLGVSARLTSSKNAPRGALASTALAQPTQLCWGRSP